MARHKEKAVLSANGSHSKRNTRHSALIKAINIHAKDGLQQCKRCPFRWQKATFCKTNCRKHRTHKYANAATFCNTHTYVCTRKTAIFWPAAFYFTKNVLTETRRKTICKQTKPVPLHFGNSHCAYKQPYMRITGAHENYVKNSLNRSPPHGSFKVSTKLAATFAPVKYNRKVMNKTGNYQLTIIIPVYNEAETLPL